MAIINLTNVFDIINNVKTNLFYEDDFVMKFYNANTLILQIDSGFYISKDPEMDVTSPTYQEGYKEFYSCTIADVEDTNDLTPIIKKTTHVIVGNDTVSDKYTVEQYIRPRTTGTKYHKLRLAPA